MDEKNNSNPVATEYTGEPNRHIMYESARMPSKAEISELAERLRTMRPGDSLITTPHRERVEGTELFPPERIEKAAEILKTLWQYKGREDYTEQYREVNGFVADVCAKSQEYFSAQLDKWLSAYTELADTHTVYAFPSAVAPGSLQMPYSLTSWRIQRFYALIPRDFPNLVKDLTWEQAKERYPTLELTYNLNASTSGTIRHGHKKEDTEP